MCNTYQLIRVDGTRTHPIIFHESTRDRLEQILKALITGKNYAMKSELCIWLLLFANWQG